MNIETIDILHKEKIEKRLKSSNKFVSCIDINALSGDISIAMPIDNTIDFFGQSPANNSTISIQSIEGYGELNFPICVKSDFCRNITWIADTGSNKIIKTIKKYSNIEFLLSIDDITNPYNLIINPNNGGIIVKHYKDGYEAITYFDSFGNLIFTIKTLYILPQYDSTQKFIESLPIQTSMAIDHVRNKLWFLSEKQLYSVDLNIKYCTHFSIDSLIDINKYISIDIDLQSGNPLLFASKNSRNKNGTVIEINNENNIIIGTKEVERSTSDCSVIETETKIKKNLIFMKFKNPIMIGEWSYYDKLGYENNNAIRKIISKRSKIGSWTACGFSEPENIFYGCYFVEDGSDSISEFWQYKKDISVTNLYDDVVVSKNEVSGLYRLERYAMGSSNNAKPNPFIEDYGYVIEKDKYPLCNCDYDLNSPDYDSYYADFPFKGF